MYQSGNAVAQVNKSSVSLKGLYRTFYNGSNLNVLDFLKLFCLSFIPQNFFCREDKTVFLLIYFCYSYSESLL